MVFSTVQQINVCYYDGLLIFGLINLKVTISGMTTVVLSYGYRYAEKVDFYAQLTGGLMSSLTAQQ
jgi:hypothetical protein